ncbi:competence protein CoiA [Planococcus dechangensis]|uniref:Competence protein CoiA n=1 Tax=Planococcus dechangensis TaxID=1176255 RepID=A0ABV9M9W7_9BACL
MHNLTVNRRLRKRRVIDILTALHEQALFVLQEHHTRAQLLELRRTSRFYCPNCEAQVILKVGTTKIPHFAHLQSCKQSHEPETLLHLLGKSRLYSFLQQQQLSPRLEQYIPDIKQRADLLVASDALEFQCSVLTAEHVSKRSNGYRSIQIEPIWIRGTETIPHSGPGIFQIRPFEREMFLGDEDMPHLLSFHPKKSLFIYFSNLFYLQGNRWVGKASILDMAHQTYPFAIPKRLGKSEYELMAAMFRLERNKYIRSQLFARNRMRNAFWRLTYELQVDKQAVPEIFGLPLPGGHWITEHALVWQMKAALMIHSGKPVEDLLDKESIRLSSVGKREKVYRLLRLYESIYQASKEASSAEMVDISYQALAKAWEN